jgi:hypothetical protein
VTISDFIDDTASPQRPDVRARVRAVASVAITVLATVLVLVVFLAPRPDEATLLRLLRIPVEALVGLGLLLAVPRRRARTVVAAMLGAALGLWAVLRVVDAGFIVILQRPFDPILDGSFLSSGVDVIRHSLGNAGALGVEAAAILLAVAVVVAVALAVVRLAHVTARHRRPTAVTVGVLAVVWVVCLATGAQLVAGSPIAARDYVDRLGQERLSLGDRAAFAEQLGRDAYRETPGDQLLTSLRGKDVLLVVVESYGRVAVEDPGIAPTVTSVLHDGERALAASGFRERSAFLTSPTVGGGSWLADSTLLSGAWVNNQQRYVDVANSNRLPLTGAFRRAGWTTVGVLPGTTSTDWSEGHYYDFDRLRTFHDLGYAGPKFTFDTMPDQYVLSVFQHDDMAPSPRNPVMATVVLISSHAPWTPVPNLVDWNALGNGSGFPTPAEKLEPAESVLTSDPAVVRTNYAHAIAYSISALLSYVEHYADDNTVVMFLGDHQPVSAVTGTTTNRDVPISILARDPTVLDRVNGWGWQDGLVPGPDAPVWRMDGFRDRFLDTFR